MTVDGILLAFVIFVLRVINFSLGTVRMMVTTRQMRALAAGLAVIEAFIFAVVMANVVTDLTNWMNLAGYCLGAGGGSYIGMLLESRFITSYRIVNVFSSVRGHEMAIQLRNEGFGVTEALGEGKEGAVTMLRSVVTSRHLSQFIDVARNVNPDAFIAIEEARAVRQGWIRAPRGARKLE